MLPPFPRKTGFNNGALMKPGDREKMTTTWFVSRHPGALEWARRQGIQVDRQLSHLEVDRVQPGDTVIGTLPVHMVWAVNRRGGSYLHLSLDVPERLRGRELSADDLETCGARLEAFRVERDKR